MSQYTYVLELHYRYGKYADEKDFFQHEVIAESDEEAKRLGKELRRSITNVIILDKKLIN